MTTIELLDRVKARHGLTSDYQLAKHMGWTCQTVSDYRNRRRSLGEASALQVAAALDVDPGYVLAVTAAERAQSAAVRSAWERAAARLGGALAASLLLCVVALALPGSDASAASVGPAALLIMSNAVLLLLPAYLLALSWAFQPQIAQALGRGAELLKLLRAGPMW
jgi:transcriptional regulator with XRE-family HTH domain